MMGCGGGFGWGWMGSWGWVSALINLVVMLVVLGVIIGLLVWVLRRWGRAFSPETLTSPDDPKTILKARYARGEITREQYLEMLRDLEQKA